MWQEWFKEVPLEIAKRNRNKYEDVYFSDWKIPNKLKALMKEK